TASVAHSPGATVIPEVRPISVPAVTAAVAFPLTTLGAEEAAVMTADPADTPFTSSEATLAPAGNVAVAGTVATPALSELSVTCRPLAGAGADNVRVMVCE